MKRHWLMLVGLLVVSSQVGATDNARVVELAVFSCPYCKKLQASTMPLHNRLGTDFIFAPVAFDGNNSQATRAYYALRDQFSHRKLTQALFQMIQGMRMSPQNESDVLQYLHFKGMTFNDQSARKAMTSDAVNAAMARARRLASMAGVQSVPALVLVDNGRVINTWHKSRNRSDAQLVQSVINAWEARHEGH